MLISLTRLRIEQWGMENVVTLWAVHCGDLAYGYQPSLCVANAI